MSAPAVFAAVKIIGVALSVKTLISGLKEGNLLKAVLGGVGAYFGVSALTAQTATQTAANAGLSAAEGGASVAEAGASVIDAGEAAVAEAAGETVLSETGGLADNLTSGLNASGEIVGDAAGLADTTSLIADQSTAFAEPGLLSQNQPFAPDQAGLLAEQDAAFAEGLAPSTTEALSNPGAAEGLSGANPSIFEQISNWTSANPKVAQGLLKAGGSALEGYGKERMLEDNWKRLQEEAARRRNAQGTGVTAGYLSRFRPVKQPDGTFAYPQGNT